MSTMEAYPRLLDALNGVRARWRLHKLLEGALLAFAGTALVLAVLVAADNLWQPGTAGRFLLACGLWCTLAVALLGLVVRRVLEDRRDDFFAALVEQKHPELHNRLINALQLGRDNQRGFSRRLIQAIVRDADKAAADMDMGDAIDSRPARRAGLWALGAVLLIAGYAGAFTPRFLNGLARVLLPASNIAPYTQTQIVEGSVEPGDKNVAEGDTDPIVFKVKVRGVIPATATLHRKTGKGTWQVNAMQPEPGAEDTFRFSVQQAAESFDYYVTANDARSAPYHIEVVRPPQVEKLSLTYTPPAYTGLQPTRVAHSDGTINGIAGTVVDVELKATNPLATAHLLTRAGEKIDLGKRGDERTWGCSFTLWTPDAKQVDGIKGRLLLAPTTYQIKLQDSLGYPNIDPLWRTIALTRDQAPTVNVLAPGDKLSVKADTVLPLTVESRDDYGLGEVRLRYKLTRSGGDKVEELARFAHDKAPELHARDPLQWSLASSGVKVGDRVEYWAEAVDRNAITGPGKSESRHLSLDVVNPLDVAAKLDLTVMDYAQALEALLKLQRENRAGTAEAAPFKDLVTRQSLIRIKTRELARVMERDGLPLKTVIKALDDLAAGPMAEALALLESGRGAEKESLAGEFRNRSLPVQDRIIKELEELLARLQRNEQAKKALRKIEKKDPAAHKTITAVLGNMLKRLDDLLKDQTELAGKFERLPRKDQEKFKEEHLKALQDLEALKKRTDRWRKGSVQELTKLPEGFIKDFDPRKDVNKVFEEIEKQEARSKAEKAEVSLEDLGAGLATKMKEDLEIWLPDAPDSIKWVLEEPLNKKPMKIPEMPLPKALEDLVGDLLQKADEFDEDADDNTSAWGDNLDQNGWGTSDGPISTFSAKGKTGNDQPNNMELTGRSGDGRRGKSTGQMVGDTARGLPGRKTPARVGKEKNEPGQLKQEGQEDPNGATGGGKKAGAGRIGLQGGNPPDMVKDIGRLSARQAGMREKMEQVARKLEAVGVSTRRLNDSIELMRKSEKDLADHRYEDAARKRRDALKKLRTAFGEVDRSTAARIHRARDLPPELRKELLQSADEAYPAGYEGLLRSYYKALSTAEK